MAAAKRTTGDPPPRKTPRKAQPKKKDVAAPQVAALLKTFGHNLKSAREEAGLSQRGLSALAGISQRHISAIEMGNVNVSIATVVELSLHVGKTAVELLTPIKR